MNNEMDIEATTPGWDTLSTTDSETSAAVVSLYQSWTGISLCGTNSTTAAAGSVVEIGSERDHSLAADGLECYMITTRNVKANPADSVSWDRATGSVDGDDEITLLELDEEWDQDSLRQALRKRLRCEKDIPSFPSLKRRRKPVCHFLNYMGKRHVEPPPVASPIVVDDCLWHLGLGLAENDALFPLSVAEKGTSTTEESADPTPSTVTTKNVFATKTDDAIFFF